MLILRAGNHTEPTEYYSPGGSTEVLTALLRVSSNRGYIWFMFSHPLILGTRCSEKEDTLTTGTGCLLFCILVTFCMLTFSGKKEASGVVKSINSWARLLWLRIPALQHPDHVTLSKLHKLSVLLYPYLKTGMVRIIPSTSQFLLRINIRKLLRRTL